MNNQQQENQAIRCLAKYGYIVSRNGQEYVVCHVYDTNDVSHMRHLADLVDFAELIEWINERDQKAQSVGS